MTGRAARGDRHRPCRRSRPVTPLASPPLRGFGQGVMQIAIRYRTDAWRVVYLTEMAGQLWGIHAFRKKSKTGIKTPESEIDLIGSRLTRLRRELMP